MFGLLVAGCTPTPPTQPSVTDVVIEGGNRTIDLGATQQLDVTVVVTGGASQAVTWSTSNATIVSVTATGTITGESVGVAEITATSVADETVSDTITVTVSADDAVLSVTIVGGDRGLVLGSEANLEAAVVVTGAAAQAVTWSTSNATIVSVTATGTITGESVGVAEITATSVADETISDTITVTVSVESAVLSVTIVGGDRELDLWSDAQLEATVAVEGGASQAVAWSSSAAGVVSVSLDGLITAVSAGSSAVITATSVADGTVSDTITVTVPALPSADPSEIFVDASVPPGGNGNISFPFQDITSGVAAVDPGGIVRVLSGLYEESLHITKSLELLGAGAGSVTIRSDGDASGIFSEASIDLENVTGVTLSGFTLEVVAPGPTFAAIGIAYTGSSNVLVEDVDIRHTNASRSSRGVAIFNGSGITLSNVDIEAAGGDGGHSGAGVQVSGTASNIVLDGVVTRNHESYAGVALIPGAVAATVSDVTITNASVFNEVNKMTLGFTNGGTVTGLSAPQFVAAVGNTSSAYGDGLLFFYKTSVQRAILDSLFNFGATGDGGQQAWLSSTVQTLDPLDQAIRQNSFVVGSVLDTEYGFGITRSHLLQAALDVAAPNATISVQAGIYDGVPASAFGGTPVDGAIEINVPGVDIVGVAAGGASQSVIRADVGPVFTVNADNVTISGVEVAGGAGVTGILMGTGNLLTVSSANLVSDIAMDNSVGASVTATNNYWGAASGPSGDGPGTGAELIDPTTGVVFEPFAATPF